MSTDQSAQGVSTEDANETAQWLDDCKTSSHPSVNKLVAHKLRTLVSERDALAVRVRELEAAIHGVIQWDARRNFPIPYKVRDPLRAALTTSERPAMNERETEGWKEAAIAWSVCASIHETWAKGKDALYKTRHADFVRHADHARAALTTPESKPWTTT